MPPGPAVPGIRRTQQFRNRGQGRSWLNLSPLLADIKKLIKTSGPLPVWRYMQLCLTHPQHGYYYRVATHWGARVISSRRPKSARCSANCSGLWGSLGVAVDRLFRPTLRLIEFGPGRGTMMADALRALRVLPPMYQALSVHLIEINPALREKQKAALSSAPNIPLARELDDCRRAGDHPRQRIL